MIVELRQQVSRDGRHVFEIDRVYMDGRAVGVIARTKGATFLPSVRLPDVQVKAVLDGIDAVRGKSGTASGAQPIAPERIAAAIENGPEEDDDDE